MLQRLILLVLLASALVGCKPPPEAPTELGDLTLYLFANFDDPDPAVMQAGVVNMLAFLEGYEADVDLAVDTPVTERAWSIPALEEENWGGAPHWVGGDIATQMPVGVAARSAFGGNAHAELVGLADQTPLESSSSARYDRSFDTDFDSWLTGDAKLLRTTNEIDRDNILLTLTYTAYKDYRWIELPDDGGQAVVARSWIDDQYINEDGAGTANEDTMDFFSNVEMTIPSAGGTLRYNCLWGAVVFTPEVDETVLLNTVRNGMQEGYENTEAYLEGDGS